MTADSTYKTHIQRLRARGVKLVAFQSPCCDKQIETQAAPEGDVWDTTASCPHCNNLYVKLVYHDRAEGRPFYQ